MLALEEQTNNDRTPSQPHINDRSRRLWLLELLFWPLGFAMILGADWQFRSPTQPLINNRNWLFWLLGFALILRACWRFRSWLGWCLKPIGEPTSHCRLWVGLNSNVVILFIGGVVFQYLNSSYQYSLEHNKAQEQFRSTRRDAHEELRDRLSQFYETLKSIDIHDPVQGNAYLQAIAEIVDSVNALDPKASGKSQYRNSDISGLLDIEIRAIEQLDDHDPIELFKLNVRNRLWKNAHLDLKKMTKMPTVDINDLKLLQTAYCKNTYDYYADTGSYSSPNHHTTIYDTISYYLYKGWYYIYEFCIQVSIFWPYILLYFLYASVALGILAGLVKYYYYYHRNRHSNASS
jgi:hypothetical protein